MKIKFLQDIDFVEKLEKNELYKKVSGTTLDPNEIRIGLQIVPKIVMKFLTSQLVSMPVDSGKDIPLDSIIENGHVLSVTKHGNDAYSGNVHKEGKICVDFAYRSIPGVGIVLMSAFELYDVDQLELAKVTPADDEAFRNKSALLDEMISEKFRLISLIESVVDKKLSQRNAIEQLFREKMTQEIKKPEPLVIAVEAPKEELTKEEPKPLSKSLKLKNFLENRKAKKTKKDSHFVFKMEKSEAVCPHCKEKLFSSEGFSGCVCLGEDQQNTVLVTKNEKGIKFSFHRSWDVENIQLVLEAIKKSKV